MTTDRNQDRTADGVEHLQAAALEMIGAARAFLDVLEDVVADRDRVEGLVAGVGDVLSAAARAADPNRAGRRGPDGGDHVEHIRVS